MKEALREMRVMNETMMKPLSSSVVELTCTDGNIVLCHLWILRVYSLELPTLPLTRPQALFLLDLLEVRVEFLDLGLAEQISDGL